MVTRQQQKAETHERIIEAAGRVFSRSGFGGGVAEVMAEAGLTHGGFYAHFDNKADLVAEVMRTAVEKREAVREAGLEGLDGWDWLRGMVGRYLSMEHRSAIEAGCLMPPLVSELSRWPEARATFEQALTRLIDRIADQLPGEAAVNRERAMRVLSVCVGGLALSRAVADEQLAATWIEQARAAAFAMIERWERDDA